MATISKNFRIKNGLIVEGTTATVNGNSILTTGNTTDQMSEGQSNLYFTDERVREAVNSLISAGTHENIVITYDGENNTLSFVAENGVDDSTTDDLEEGSLNLYFTDGRAKDAIAAAIAGGTHENITIGYDSEAKVFTFQAENGVDDSTTDDLDEGSVNLYFTNQRALDAVQASYESYADAAEAAAVSAANSYTDAEISSLDSSLKSYTDAAESSAISSANSYTDSEISAHSDSTSGVHGVTGDVVGTTDAQTVSNKTLGSNLNANENQITNLGTPTQAHDAATKQYVDSFVEGLHVHASVSVATSSNISDLSDPPATIDGVSLEEDMRILVKAQTNKEENGIYVVSSGALIRATDHDSSDEVQAGDFVFVTYGDVYAATGWVQINTVDVLGTDAQEWDQFSGAGTYLGGNGINLNGNTFSIDTDVTATKTYVDGEISSLDSSLKTYADAAEAAAVTSANSYTDGEISSLDASLKSYTDAAESNAISTASADATSKANAAESSANAYTDSEISSLDASLKAYADSAEAAANTYTDNAIIAADTDDIQEGAGNLYFTDKRAQDAAAAAIAAGTHENIVITYDSNAGSISFQAENGVEDSTTDDLDEGTNNLYFTDQRAIDALESVTPTFTEVDVNSVALNVASSVSVPVQNTTGVVYSFDSSEYTSAKFLIKFDTGSHTEISEILLTLDSSNNISITEYAVVGSNGSLGSVTAAMNEGIVEVQATVVNDNTEVSAYGTLLV